MYVIIFNHRHNFIVRSFSRFVPRGSSLGSGWSTLKNKQVAIQPILQSKVEATPHVPKGSESRPVSAHSINTHVPNFSLAGTHITYMTPPQRRRNPTSNVTHVADRITLHAILGSPYSSRNSHPRLPSQKKRSCRTAVSMGPMEPLLLLSLL